MRQVRAPVAVRRSGAQVHMLTPCERWAGEHELQMSVGERPRWVEAPRYFAKLGLRREIQRPNEWGKE